MNQVESRLFGFRFAYQWNDFKAQYPEAAQTLVERTADNIRAIQTEASNILRQHEISVERFERQYRHRAPRGRYTQRVADDLRRCQQELEYWRDKYESAAQELEYARTEIDFLRETLYGS